MARQTSKILAVAGSAGVLFALAGSITFAQRVTPADVAAKMTGTWQMNMDLSPQWAPRGGGPARGAAGTGRGGTPYFAIGMMAASVSAAPALQGGGGRSGGGADISDADRAGNAVMAMFRGAPLNIAIKATADSVTFADARGERTFAIDNKSAKVVINQASITTKSRWDRNTLKQEFVYGESRVTHDFELNAEGTRINFKMVSQNMSSTGPATEAKAVYDKK